MNAKQDVKNVTWLDLENVLCEIEIKEDLVKHLVIDVLENSFGKNYSDDKVYTPFELHFIISDIIHDQKHINIVFDYILEIEEKLKLLRDLIESYPNKEVNKEKI